MAGNESDIRKILEDAMLRRDAEILEIKDRLKKQSFELPPLLQASSDNFARCVSPKAAIESYGFSSPDLAITQMMRELKHDRVQAVCHEAILHLEDGKTRKSFAVVPSWFWYRSPPPSDSDFWETGYLFTIIPANEAGDGMQGSLEFFNVRFWPNGLPGDAESTPLNSKGEASKPPVSKSDLAMWHEIFVKVHPNAVEAQALRSAAAMFPDNHVPRQWVRDLRGPQKRGKPTSRHE